MACAGGHGNGRNSPRGATDICRGSKQYTLRNLHEIPEYHSLPEELQFELEVVGQVLPFKTSRYVLEQLVDWKRVPDDPLYRLTLPQRGMLRPEEFRAVARRVKQIRAGTNAERAQQELQELVHRIRYRLNPQPAGQLEKNVPVFEGKPLEGVQHKYRETALYFPKAGQSCFAYCTFCFRWAQFVGIEGLRFAARSVDRFVRYLKEHPTVTDVLITGGDPMVMGAQQLRETIEPLLGAGLEHVRTIRIGTKSLSYWPHRYIDDPDGEAVLRLFSRVVESGRQLAIMAQFNHPRELEPRIVARASRRLLGLGAIIRTQSPLLRHINDTPGLWRQLWQRQIELGMVPYYMFVERDTGPREYFELPLSRAYRIYREAVSGLSGLARTARGPVMSATPGKVEVQGVANVGGRKCFVLRYIQARDASRVDRPFFAEYDPDATWFDQLKPASAECREFFDHYQAGVHQVEN